MSRYNTGNPLESDQLVDFEDNTKNFDVAVNGTTGTWTDRFGVERLSMFGSELNAKAVVAAAKLSETKAAASAASAAYVVSGGTATLIPEAGKIPMAKGDGKIDSYWLDVKQTAGQSATALMSQKAITDAIAGYSPFLGKYGLAYNEVEDTYNRTGSQNYTAIQSIMSRCLVMPDGSIDYYLSATNSNYKADGTPANITGADGYLGNVMVQIPKYYRKITTKGDVVTREVSLYPEDGFNLHPAFMKAGIEVPFRYYRAYRGVEIDGRLRSVSGAVPTRYKSIAQFRTLAKANGEDWHQIDWMLLDAVRELLSIEIGTYNSQSVLGEGNSTGGNYEIATGTSNSIGNGSSTSTTSAWMSYRGIENFYASFHECIDGINIKDSEPFVNSDHRTFASDVFTGDYVSVGVTQPNTNGFISEMLHTETGFFVKKVTGGSTTFFADYYFQAAGNRIWTHGGSSGQGPTCGAFASYTNYSSGTMSLAIGAGIAF